MAHTLYPDSSFLVSLLRRDINHDSAAAYMAKNTAALIFDPLHRAEVRNALRWAETLGSITRTERMAAFRSIEDDLREGLLIPTSFSWTDALRRADKLSEMHREKDGQRTLDLLHVAIALEVRTSIFLTFDKRQRRLACAAGLQVGP